MLCKTVSKILDKCGKFSVCCANPKDKRQRQRKIIEVSVSTREKVAISKGFTKKLTDRSTRPVRVQMLSGMPT